MNKNRSTSQECKNKKEPILTWNLKFRLHWITTQILCFTWKKWLDHNITKVFSTIHYACPDKLLVKSSWKIRVYGPRSDTGVIYENLISHFVQPLQYNTFWTDKPDILVHFNLESTKVTNNSR